MPPGRCKSSESLPRNSAFAEQEPAGSLVTFLFSLTTHAWKIELVRQTTRRRCRRHKFARQGAPSRPIVAATVSTAQCPRGTAPTAPCSGTGPAESHGCGGAGLVEVD